MRKRANAFIGGNGCAVINTNISNRQMSTNTKEPRYITVDQAIHFSRLRYSSDLDRDELGQMICAAEETLAHDLQVDDLSAVVDESGVLPADLRQALLILTGDNYRERESLSAVQLYKSPHYWHLIHAHVNYLCE